MRAPIFGLVAVLIPLAVGCPRSQVGLEIPGITRPKASDEEKIVTVLNDVQRGIQTKRIYKVLAHVSKDYYDQEGRDYEAIREYLNRLFKEYREIRITRTRPRVIVQGDRAQAVETFGTQAKPSTPRVGRPIDIQGQVTVYLEKVGEAWQIVSWGVLK